MGPFGSGSCPAGTSPSALASVFASTSLYTADSKFEKAYEAALVRALISALPFVLFLESTVVSIFVAARESESAVERRAASAIAWA